MKFVIARDALLKPLNLVAGAVERRQTLPILANVLMALDDGWLSLTGTDLEGELGGRVKLATPATNGEVTVPARKLVDICKSLPEGCDIEFTAEDGRVVVRSGRSRFTLATLPAREFPNVEDSIGTHKITLLQGQLRRLVERTAFAMAQQDVRYYLNGMLWETAKQDIAGGGDRRSPIGDVYTGGRFPGRGSQAGDFAPQGRTRAGSAVAR